MTEHESPLHSPSPLEQLPNTYRAFYGGFSGLYAVQLQAIAPILAGQDVLLQSSTGSGKSEAVLAPCLERVIRSGRHALVIYIVPTRALAIDIERRFKPVLEDRLELKIALRTGDAKRGDRSCPDLLITTPESLDVAIGSVNADLRGTLARARTLIIDEVHQLVQSTRGKQLDYLLQRLERRLGRPLQRIALSATIAAPELVTRFFHFRSETRTILAPTQREIVPHIIRLKRETLEFPALLDDLVARWNYRKILVFANSRGQCDRLLTLANAEGPFRGAAELHYSNLKPRERHGVEKRFRRQSQALCIATSTLELGIDIGDVDGVLLYEPPDSASAFLQRIGRANRRQQATHFWGICRGERAGKQLLRFLALLDLARRGVVERKEIQQLPSVLVQQCLSCLYEKKGISLPALQDLFPFESSTLEALFPRLVDRNWLMEDKFGLWKGGRRYWEALLEQKIWSNFPEQEEDFVLELLEEAIADIPKSIVKQLEPGRQVHLAGKRLKISQIEEGERNRVVARPADDSELHQLVWLGAGFQVSFEVAQAIRSLLRKLDSSAERSRLGLFSRTQALLNRELKQNSRVIPLPNGIELSRTATGILRFRTYLGSIGNLILRSAIDARFVARESEEQVSSDELGIESSVWIDFQKLNLPVTLEELRAWVAPRADRLGSMLSLNAFASELPKHLLIQEVASHLYDERIAQAFKGYLETPCPEPELSLLIELDSPARQEGLRTDAESRFSSTPLLEWEKARQHVSERVPFEVQNDALRLKRALTATILGEYVRHQLCERWLSFTFLEPAFRPPAPLRSEDELANLRTELGHLHEERVVMGLKTVGPVVVIAEADERGRRRTLSERHLETRRRLLELLAEARQATGYRCFLSQAVLLQHLEFTELLSCAAIENSGPLDTVEKNALLDGDPPLSEGVGIPDLIEIRNEEGQVVLEVGDVKDSSEPRMNQKWQVSYYAFLLRKCLESLGVVADATAGLSGADGAAVDAVGVVEADGAAVDTVGAVEADGAAVDAVGVIEADGAAVGAIGVVDADRASSSVEGNMSVRTIVRLSNRAFLLLRPSPGEQRPQRHNFDLAPYLSTLPTLLARARRVLSGPPGDEDYFLRSHCTSCPYWEHCTLDALQSEELQLLPGQSPGLMERLRVREISTIAQLAEALTSDRVQDNFTPRQRQLLQWRASAFLGHRGIVKKATTTRFPSNLSGIMLLHVLENPLSGQPRAIALRTLDQSGASTSFETWFPEEGDPSREWPKFRHALVKGWTDLREGSAGPQLLCFGARTIEVLQNCNPASAPGREGLLQEARIGAQIREDDDDIVGTYDRKEREDLNGVLVGESKGSPAIDFLFVPELNHVTDIRALLLECFELPIPGRLTLFSLARTLGLEPSLPEPPSLLHSDPTPPCLAKSSPLEENEREELRRLLHDFTEVECQVWTWARLRLESDWIKTQWSTPPAPVSSLDRLLTFLETERAHREQDVLELQARSLNERLERFRALGPLRLDHTELNEEGAFSYVFVSDSPVGSSKFREGDFLKLAATGASDLQQGLPVLLTRFDRVRNQVVVRSRERRAAINRRMLYSLEEDLTDYNSPKLVHIVQTAFSSESPSALRRLLAVNGHFERAGEELRWARAWLKKVQPFARLNPSQQDAVLLAFRSRLCLIEGPPGSGKTHVLAWILIALITRAQEEGRALRIAISALTHNGIDNVSRKITELVNRHGLREFTAKVFKYGRTFEMSSDGEGKGGKHAPNPALSKCHDKAMTVEPLESRAQLFERSHVILGATGFGLYRLFEGAKGRFPKVFDWVVFDEASQVLIPQALLSLVHGKGHFLFLGDVQQLPPVLMADHPEEMKDGIEVSSSILQHFQEHSDSSCRVRLNVTYRMNAEICAFPSRFWYEGALHPAPSNAAQRLESSLPERIGSASRDYSSEEGGANQEGRGSSQRDEQELLDRVLDPDLPVCVVLCEHHLSHQQSEVEAELMCALALRLLKDRAFEADRLALISPHRAQNNVIADRLSQALTESRATEKSTPPSILRTYWQEGRAMEFSRPKTKPTTTVETIPLLPTIDTVERLQGAERDVIIFGFTTSDLDHIEAPFLNNPNRFNVAITRARKKLIVVGSTAFFSQIPRDEDALEANACFKEFLEYCREQGAVFRWTGGFQS